MIALDLNTEQCEKLFPFHVAFDGALRVTSLGRALRRQLSDDAIGRGLVELFSIVRPALTVPSLSTLLARKDAVFLLGVRGKPLKLRGEVVECLDGALFVGTPWLTELGQLKDSGLVLKDFALHDPTGELLVVLKTMEMSLRDARQIAENLREEMRRRGEALNELCDKLATVEAQRRALLGARTVHLWEGVLVAPVLGAIDDERSAQLLERVRAAVVGHRVHWVIIDVAHVDGLDPPTAQACVRVAHAVRLLGVQGAVSGLGPEVVRAFVENGGDLRGVAVFADLQEACVAAISADSGRRPSAGNSPLTSGRI